MRVNTSPEQLTRNATTLASLRAQQDELEGELATLKESHGAMLASQIALKDDLASSRKRIVELEMRREELKRMNMQLAEEMRELERVHADQLASLSKESETLVATNEAFTELMQWQPTSLADCQGFIRDKQLLARGKAIINAFPDTRLAKDASAIQSYVMRVTLSAEDPESVRRLVEMIGESSLMSHYDHLMIEYGKDPEVFLWLAETKAVLTEVAKLA